MGIWVKPLNICEEKAHLSSFLSICGFTPSPPTTVCILLPLISLNILRYLIDIIIITMCPGTRAITAHKTVSFPAHSLDKDIFVLFCDVSVAFLNSYIQVISLNTQHSVKNDYV